MKLVFLLININCRPGQLPSHAIVWGRDARDRQLICGGAVVSKYYVLTAAHCIEKQRRDKVGPVIVGGVYLSPRARNNRNSHKIVAIEIHPKRNRVAKTNDLAVIKVRRPFNFSENIQPIPIGNLSVDRLHENETVNVLLLQRNLSLLMLFV